MKALLVVDMQVGCFADEPCYDEAGTVERIQALIAAVRPRGKVVFVQHTDPAEGFARGSERWKLLPALAVDSQDIVFEKSACDSFLETELDDILRRHAVTELIVVGYATDFCIDITVKSAASHGYDVIVPGDGHTTNDRPHWPATQVIAHHNYLWAELLLPRQRKVRVVSTAALLAELRP